MLRAAIEVGLIKEIPQRDREDLGEARRQAVKEGGRVRCPGEAYERMAEFVGSPLASMRGVKAANWVVISEMTKLMFPEGAAFPVRARHQLWSLIRHPTLRDGEVCAMLKVTEEETTGASEFADSSRSG